MLIYVSLKDARRLSKRVSSHPFYLENTPASASELIGECVRTCIREFSGRADAVGSIPPLTSEQMDGMREVGKFAFGVVYGRTDTDEEKAIATALSAVEDGLVRIFNGSEEITLDDEHIKINEGDTLTFVKLSMLTGRLW